MKIARNDPVRRRRSPVSMLLLLVALILIALLVVAWIKGGGQTPHQVEIPIPAEQLGH